MNIDVEPDDPGEVAEAFAAAMNHEGYRFDFTVKSLETEVDKLLEAMYGKPREETNVIETRLGAYIGETICRNFDAVWAGSFYDAGKGFPNFYTSQIKAGDFQFGPTHFIKYYFSNGKESEGSFYDYLYARDQSQGIFHDFLGGGLILKITNAQ